MREDAFFHAGEEDDGEFQPFRGVQRHQRDCVVVLVRRRYRVGDQRDLLQEGVQVAPLIVFRLRLEIPAWRRAIPDVLRPRAWPARCSPRAACVRTRSPR